MIKKEDEIKNSVQGIKVLLTIFLISCVDVVLYVNGNKDSKNNSNIYILIWTTPEVRPFPDGKMEMGNQYFINKKCKYQNCVVTNDKKFFNDIKLFDIVMFHCLDVARCGKPPARSIWQKYVFVSEEPVHYCVLSADYNSFFNLTWTFKFDSDATMKYYKVKNRKGKVIGPKKDMHWKNITLMKPVSKYIKRKLQTKSKAAAWFVSNCWTPSLREGYVQSLRNELAKYQLGIDQYGRCSELQCHKNSMDECYAMLESDYYFYLSFENSFHEDYVTEKVLTAVEHFSVPIVYGSANYTR